MWYGRLENGIDVLEDFVAHTEWVEDPVYNEINMLYNRFYEEADSEFGWTKVRQISNSFKAADEVDDSDPFDYDGYGELKKDPLMKFSKKELINLAIPMAYLIGYAAAAQKYLESKEASK